MGTHITQHAHTHTHIHTHTHTCSAMASVDMKVQILRRSISSLNRWLEASQQLLAVIPMELEANNQLDRRELALKYKVKDVVMGWGGGCYVWCPVWVCPVCIGR